MEAAAKIVQLYTDSDTEEPCAWGAFDIASDFMHKEEAIKEHGKHVIRLALFMDAFAAQQVATRETRLIEWLEFKINAAQRAAEKVRQQDAYTSDYETHAEAITAAFNEVREHLKS